MTADTPETGVGIPLDVDTAEVGVVEILVALTAGTKTDTAGESPLRVPVTLGVTNRVKDDTLVVTVPVVEAAEEAEMYVVGAPELGDATTDMHRSSDSWGRHRSHRSSRHRWTRHSHKQKLLVYVRHRRAYTTRLFFQVTSVAR